MTGRRAAHDSTGCESAGASTTERPVARLSRDPAFRGSRIRLIDKDASYLKYLADSLRVDSYSVDKTTNGADA